MSQEQTNNWLKENWFKLLAVLFLLGALGNWPYAYYQLLRWLILGIGGYSAYLAYNSEKKTWAVIFGVIAVLFNPVIPFYLQKGTWQLVDLITAIIFFISLFYKYDRKN